MVTISNNRSDKNFTVWTYCTTIKYKSVVRRKATLSLVANMSPVCTSRE